MTSARLPLQAAIVAALTAPGSGVPAGAVTATPRDSAPLPLVVVGLDTEAYSDEASDKDADAGALTHTVRVYASSSTQAKTLAAAAFVAMTGPLAVAGFSVVRARLDFAAPGFEPGPPPAYADTVRVRYTLAPNP